MKTWPTTGRSVRATREEQTRAFPGDERIPHAVDTLTHGVTIQCAPPDVWPWLVQMGAGSRAGWYSYDWLDNGRQPSAARILPELQHPAVGTIFPALPGVTDGFVVLAIEPGRILTLGWPARDGTTEVTWTFVLHEKAPGVTRLLVRVRGGPGYRFHGLPLLLTRLTIRVVHFIMQRKQLRGVARRAETAMSQPSAFMSPKGEAAHRAAYDAPMTTWPVPYQEVDIPTSCGTTLVVVSRTAMTWAAGAVGVATAAYAAYVGATWLRYGQPAPPSTADADPLLEQFMPVYEVAERHHIQIAAPADVTFAAACEQDLMALPVVRALFKTREVVLGGQPDTIPRPRGLLALTKSIGWGVLADEPGREVVMGAVTQPWYADVVFRGLPPHEFAAFNEPGFVKIVWTLRADATGPHDSLFRTETRVVTTDAEARARFRWYWARFSPGILLVRWLSLATLRRDAERRARMGIPAAQDSRTPGP